MNEKQQIFEVINGFKNLASKFKKDNDEIKVSTKYKDTTIAACKKEYQKLYFEHEELKKNMLNKKTIFNKNNNNNNNSSNNKVLVFQ